MKRDRIECLREILNNNENVYKIEFLFKENAEFKSLIATKIYKELIKTLDIIFTEPEITEDSIDCSLSEYAFFIKGDIDVNEVKTNIDKICENQPEIDAYFTQKILIEDLDDYLDYSENQQLPELNEIEDSKGQQTIYDNEDLSGFEVRDIKVNSIRIDLNKVEVLNNLAGELVTCKAQITQALNSLKTIYDKDKKISNVIDYLEKGTAQLNRISFELQENVIQLRMFPVKNIFRKIPRIARDLSNKLNKEVDLEMTGEDTELDKIVLEHISDPLIHIIRNCIDHGIESPEERERKGKKSKGKIKLRAYNDGDMVFIEVADDGRGIDIEKVKQKAIEKGMISIEEAGSLSKNQILDFLFTPGFSTSDEINEISGRGVGMDVVRKNISLVKGNVKIETEKDIGTKFIIQIPLTIAIIKALLTEVGKRLYLLPIDRIVETVKVKRDLVRTINNKSVINMDGEIIPIINLNYIINSGTNLSQEHTYLVVANYNEYKIGLAVDKLLGEQEVVVKALDKYIGNVDGIMGATILGDGRVALILEPMGLINKIVLNQEKCI